MDHQPSDLDMWVVYEAAPTLYIARLITHENGEKKVTRQLIDDTTLPGLRKTLKAKGLEPLRLQDESGIHEISVLEVWV